MAGKEFHSVFSGFLRLASVPVRLATKVFGILSEASAEVGEWFIDRPHHESQ